MEIILQDFRKETFYIYFIYIFILYLYTGIHGRPQKVEGSFTKRKNNEHGSVSDNTCGEDVGTGIADKQHSLNTQWNTLNTFWLRLNIRELSEQK